jgi:hypothetical protein
MARAPIAVIVVANSITMPTVSARTLEYRMTTPPLAATSPYTQTESPLGGFARRSPDNRFRRDGAKCGRIEFVAR